MHTLTRWNYSSAIAGAIGWLALLVLLPPGEQTLGLIARLLLLALLVFTPLALTFAAPLDRAGLPALLYRTASVVTMLLAAVYAAGGAIGLSITIPQMVVAHGVLNAFGLVLCGLLAWTIAAIRGGKHD